MASLPARSLRNCHPLQNARRCMSSSTSEEEIMGVWIFHRHGDRTPGRALVADTRSYIEKDSSFWRTKIPPIDRTHYDLLSKKFPVKTDPNNNGGKFLDADSGKEPYGFLTWKGMQQLYEIGQKISQRYDIKDGKSFEDHWHIQAFSTNYLRTVKSVQCLLDGMFSSSHHESEYEHRNPESYNKSSRDCDVEIIVRNPIEETLNAFDTSPILMKGLVKEIIETSNFINHDTKAASLAARLCNYIPALIKLKSPYGGPSGINWIHAVDHFVCRESHGISLTAFSNFENNPNEEQTVQAMKHATIAHLASRFRFWYQSPPLLAAMVGPALSEVNCQMNEYINAETSIKKAFNVYSCHDVTILALLYGIGAEHLATPNELKNVGIIDSSNEKRLRYWPGYATTLTMELVRVQTKGKKDMFVINFVLDGQNIRPMVALGKGQDTMHLSDFNELMHRIHEVYPY